VASLYYTDHDTIRAEKFGKASVDDLLEVALTAGEKQAYGYINAALSCVYSTPFAIFSTGNTPTLVTDISDILTMWLAKRFTSGHGARTVGPLKELYDQAMKWLDEIRSGKLSLAGATRTNTVSSNTSGEHRVFASLDELDLVQDADQVTRLENERA